MKRRILRPHARALRPFAKISFIFSEKPPINEAGQCRGSGEGAESSRPPSTLSPDFWLLLSEGGKCVTRGEKAGRARNWGRIFPTRGSAFSPPRAHGRLA